MIFSSDIDTRYAVGHRYLIIFLDIDTRYAVGYGYPIIFSDIDTRYTFGYGYPFFFADIHTRYIYGYLKYLNISVTCICTLNILFLNVKYFFTLSLLKLFYKNLKNLYNTIF
jgi:hypothetical protein